jgi:uncharacterized OB-fold protein
MLLRSGKEYRRCVHCGRNAHPWVNVCEKCYWEHWYKKKESLWAFMEKAK